MLREFDVFAGVGQRREARRAFAPRHQHRGVDERQVVRDVAVEAAAHEVRGHEARPALVRDGVVVVDDLGVMLAASA